MGKALTNTALPHPFTHVPYTPTPMISTHATNTVNGVYV